MPMHDPSSATDAGAATGSPARRYYSVVAVDSGGLRSAGGDQLPDGVGDFRVRLSPDRSQFLFNWSSLDHDLNGRRMYIAGYTLYGQAALLKRADCGPTNLIQSFGPAATSWAYGVSSAPGSFYTWQLLGKDSHGSESVW